MQPEALSGLRAELPGDRDFLRLLRLRVGLRSGRGFRVGLCKPRFPDWEAFL